MATAQGWEGLFSVYILSNFYLHIRCMRTWSVTSVMSDSCDPWAVALQAPLSMRLSQQEYWSGLPFSSPGDLSHPGIKPTSLALAGRFFTTKPPEKPVQAVLGAGNRGRTSLIGQFHSSSRQETVSNPRENDLFVGFT